MPVHGSGRAKQTATVLGGVSAARNSDYTPPQPPQPPQRALNIHSNHTMSYSQHSVQMLGL